MWAASCELCWPQVRVVASLPCYSEKNVDQQRGRGVFEKSIAALLLLNDLGYGSDPALNLDLVYNPAGGCGPPRDCPNWIDVICGSMCGG